MDIITSKISLFLLRIYYFIKPAIPRKIQVTLRRVLVNYKYRQWKNAWPIDPTSSGTLVGRIDWPHEKQFALVLTHDVDTQKGHDRCVELMELEMKMGFRSSFNFVPERYSVSQELRAFLTDNGFEIGLHGLKHDGQLYTSRRIFSERTIKINNYLKEWNSKGFRSPSMHHNLHWIHDLNITYDSSTYDVDPFEPFGSGVNSVVPFYVSNGREGEGFVEIPCTLQQDFSLLVLLRKKDVDIWKRKIDWIVLKGGAVVMNTHPDYMCFGEQCNYDEYHVQLYEEILEYIKNKYEERYWHVLPQTLAAYVKENMDKFDKRLTSA